MQGGGRGTGLRPPAPRRIRGGACALALMLLAACGPEPGPETIELRAMPPALAVPATAPAALVASFESLCLDGPRAPDALAQRLRATDYVEAPQRGAGGMRSFVVEDRRPMVMLSADGTACAVAARARSGQRARIDAMMARRFPDAPAVTVAGAEIAWHAGPPQGVILLRRVNHPAQPSRVVLARIAPQP